jgi:hypothetical protein
MSGPQTDVVAPAAGARPSREAIVFTQPDRRFRGPAYRYVRAADRLPTLAELGSEADPICRVKLFLPSGRWTYYIAAVTRYDEQVVMTGLCLSGLGSDCDEWGDESLDAVAATRVLGLPPERDLHFRPMRRSQLTEQLRETGCTP